MEIAGTTLLRQSPATGLDLGGEDSFTYHLAPRAAWFRMNPATSKKLSGAKGGLGHKP